MANMFSSYVIRPKVFDPDPLGLPKKYQHLAYSQSSQQATQFKRGGRETPTQRPATAQSNTNVVDDFEMVEKPKKKVAYKKPLPAPATTTTPVVPN